MQLTWLVINLRFHNARQTRQNRSMPKENLGMIGRFLSCCLPFYQMFCSWCNFFYAFVVSGKVFKTSRGRVPRFYGGYWPYSLFLGGTRPFLVILGGAERNSGFYRKKLTSEFLWKHQKLFWLYLSNQISLRGRFVFKTIGRISSITSYKDHCCSFFTSWVIKQQKSCILTILEKTPNFWRMVRSAHPR